MSTATLPLAAGRGVSQIVSVRNPTLEQAILANPGDAKLWSIFGDWLEAEGDPRGAWVGLMLAREGSPTPELAKAERAFYEANKAWLVGPELLKAEGTLQWRRGFLAGAAVTSVAGLKELLGHPSARFLVHATLAPQSKEFVEFAQVLAEASPAWASIALKVDSIFSADSGPAEFARDATSLIATALGLKVVRQAQIELPYREGVTVDWQRAKQVERLTIRGANPVMLQRLLGELPPALKELRLTDFRGSAPEILVAHESAARLALICVDGEPTGEGLDALAGAARPTKLVLGMSPDAEAHLAAEVPGVSSFVRENQLETAFVLVDSPQLGAEQRASIVRIAQACGCKQLAAFIAPVQFAERTVTVCRFHSDDNTASLLPVVLANELAKSKQSRTAAITLSESNDLSKGISFGGPIAEPNRFVKRARPRVELSAAHKVEAQMYQRSDVAREVLDRLIGFDPGPDALDALLRALNESVATALHGPARPLPPLLTEEPPNPEVEEEEDEDEDEDEDEYESEDDWDTIDDAIRSELDDKPEPERREEPSRMDLPLGAPTVELAEVDEDDEELEEELDEDADPDAAEADAGEIWAQSPVDPEEDWAEEPIEDPLIDEPPDTDQITPEQVQELIPSCVRCARPTDTVACVECHEELCEGCMPVDDVNPARVCRQCAAG